MITFLCIGKLKNSNFLNLFNDYIKRIKLFTKFELIQIKDSDVETESKAILDYVENHKEKKYVLLDENGISYDSIKFSNKLKKHQQNVEDLVFIIAGATGLTIKAKSHFKDKLSLSYFTFPHEMASVILAEQIYRAYMIINNRNYHKE